MYYYSINSEYSITLLRIINIKKKSNAKQNSVIPLSL